MPLQSPASDQPELKATTFGLVQKRRRITLFKIGKIWVFKHFFDNKETFKILADS
jgi:predicted SPOUT superfamily RNA methylase MTH1